MRIERFHSDNNFDGSSADYTSIDWRLTGKVKDPMSADYARETLKSYDIPVVIISESGFFGRAGLNLPSFWGKAEGFFKIMVPSNKFEEAINILDTLFGDGWEKQRDD
jgi:hypothetical protein